MKTTSDKLLFGIIVGALLLVCAAFAIVFLRPQLGYRTEGTPQGVVFDYLLALRRGDYARAYRYISHSIARRPKSLEAFTEDIHRNAENFEFDSVTLNVEDAQIQGRQAVVQVQKTVFASDGLLGGSQSSRIFNVDLRREEGGWKIISADDYWVWFS